MGLVHDIEELAHGVAVVRDFPREPLGHGRGDVPALLLPQVLRKRRKRRSEAVEEDGPWNVAAQRHVDGFLLELPGPIPHTIAVLGDDHLRAHVVDGVAQDVGALGPEHEMVGRSDKGRRELGDEPLDVRGHVDDDHLPRRHPHVDQDVRQAVGLPPDLAIGVRPHVDVLPVLLVLADVDHPALVQKTLRLELVEDRTGGVDSSVLEAADHREAAQIEGDRRPNAPRVRVDHVELELLRVGEPGAADDAPPDVRLHQRANDAELVGDRAVRPLGVAKIDAEVDGPGGLPRGRQRTALLPAMVLSPGEHVLDRLVEKRRVFREPAARGKRRDRDRRPESPGIREDDPVQMAVERSGNQALRKAEDAFHVGETCRHLLRELELHRAGLALLVKTFLGKGVEEELGHPHRLGRGRSHRGQGFPRKEIPLRRLPFQAGENVPEAAPVGLPEPEVPADLFRKPENLLPEGRLRSPPLLQEGQDPRRIERTLRLPELPDEARGVVSRIPLGKAQANRLLPAHGGGRQTEIFRDGGAHAPRQEPGGAVSGDEADLHLRKLDPRGRVGDQNVRRGGDPKSRPGAKAADQAKGRDAQPPDPVAQVFLICEKAVGQPPGFGVQTVAHPLLEVRARREVFSTCEQQRPDRLLPGNPVHELDPTGDLRDAQDVPSVRTR